MARPGGVLLPPGVGFPPSKSRSRREGRTREGEGKRGAPPPFLVQFRLEGEGARGLPWPPLPLSTKAHETHYTPRGVSVTPRYSGIRLNSSRTLLKSKHSHPIYRSLCLDHFETPRHVCGHIRDSELPSVQQNTKTHNTDRHRTLSVRTLRVRELCRHDLDTSPVNNQ